MERVRLSDHIAEQLEGMIAEGVLKPGERLPPERRLAERLGVSRPSLREAIQKLGSKGLVTTRHGGGSYVAQRLESAFADPLIALLRERGDAEFDTLQVRMELEGLAAAQAASRATDGDRQRIRERFEAMAEIHRSGGRAVDKLNADMAFHLSIAEASHNVVVMHLMRALVAVLEGSIGEYLDSFYAKPDFVEVITGQHRLMLDAVLARDPVAARAAARSHLEFSYASYRGFETEARLTKSSRIYKSIYADDESHPERDT